MDLMHTSVHPHLLPEPFLRRHPRADLPIALWRDLGGDLKRGPYQHFVVGGHEREIYLSRNACVFGLAHELHDDRTLEQSVFGVDEDQLLSSA